MVQEIEDFYGVYILYNVNPRYHGRTYIGYTVDPNRRIKQHNTGSHAGGAVRTSGRGPWEMVLIIHGFPNEISALRFEWAWQHPEKSRRLRHVAKKKTKEKAFDFRFRIVSEMLRSGPWNRLSLTIRWLKQEYFRDFSPDLAPPVHMAIAYGLVKPKKFKGGSNRGKARDKDTHLNSASGSSHKTVQGDDDDDGDVLPISQMLPRCAVCIKRIVTGDEGTLACYHPRCSMVSHMICLARKYLSDAGHEGSQLLPMSGACPRCQQTTLWGDLIRHKRGCYQNLTETTQSEEEDEDHWANDLQTQVT